MSAIRTYLRLKHVLWKIRYALQRPVQWYYQARRDRAKQKGSPT